MFNINAVFNTQPRKVPSNFRNKNDKDATSGRSNLEKGSVAEENAVQIPRKWCRK